MENPEDVAEYFLKLVREDPDLSEGIAAVETLIEVIRSFKCTTLQELREKMDESVTEMARTMYPIAAIKTACEVFIRYVTFFRMDLTSVDECKKKILERSKGKLEIMRKSRKEVAKTVAGYINNGSKILLHSRSRTVLEALREVVKKNIQIEVFVTASQPDDSGYEKLLSTEVDVAGKDKIIENSLAKMVKELEAENIPATLILDSAVAYVLEKVDFVLVGAEAICANGGILNKIGTYTLALCAKQLRKPFYVACEGFKFLKEQYPLDQESLPDEYKYSFEMRQKGSLEKAHPLVDYTPPEYITALFTDRRIITSPAAVTKEIFRLYL